MSACTPLAVVTHTVSTDETHVPLGRYTLDPHHWSITFDVEHLKYSRFVMRFDRAQATLDWNKGGLQTSTVQTTIEAASIDTNVPLLNTLVQGPNMLDAVSYPAIRFISTQFVRTNNTQGKLIGILTIHGASQPVTLDLTFNGYGRNPLTQADTLGFSAQGEFSRAAFGLATWFPAVGDNVHVRIEAEFVLLKHDEHAVLTQ